MVSDGGEREGRGVMKGGGWGGVMKEEVMKGEGREGE